MSFLDLYQGDQDQAARMQPNEGTNLPSGFTENFNAAWSDGQLFSQSIARENARSAVVSDYINEIRQKTGQDLTKDYNPEGGGVLDYTTANERVAKMKESYPDLDLAPLTEDELNQRAVAKAQAIHRNYEALQAGEKGPGGSIGSFLGSTASAAADPINIVGLAIAPETGGIGILSSALRWGALAGVSQAAIEAASDTFKEQVQPGYMESGQPLREIGGAFVGGAVLGGATKALGNAWTRVKTGQWSTSVRDAGNVIESEANVASTNPLSGVEGEVAHREALTKTVDDILAGRPVDVSAQITPEMAAHFEAYHGTPHDFESFDTSKIGTGEGAQAYGHGLYFAENKGVAEGYRSKLADGTVIPTDLLAEYFKPGEIINSYGGGRDKVAAFDKDTGTVKVRSVDANGTPTNDLLGLRDRTHQTMPDLKELNASFRRRGLPEYTPGALYQVRVTADKDRMLDWDKPLSEQSGYVQTIIKHLLPDAEKSDFISGSGEQLHKELATVLKIRGGEGGKAAAAKALSDAGIPGIKYLDNGSRDAGEGTRNFVVFDDKHIQITHKNGKPVNAEIRQNVVDQAMGLPPKEPELPLNAPAPEPKAVGEPGPQPALQSADEMAKTLTAPDHQDAIRADIDRERAMGDVQVPGIDENGNHTMVSVDKAMDEVDAYKKLSDDIQACAAPAQEAAE